LDKEKSGHRRKSSKGHHQTSGGKMSSGRKKSNNNDVDINADIRKRYEEEKPVGFCSYDVSYGGLLTDDLMTSESQLDKSRGPPKPKRPHNEAGPMGDGKPFDCGPGGPNAMRRGGPENYFDRMNVGPDGLPLEPGADFASMDYQDLLQDYLTTRGIGHGESSKKSHGASKRSHSASKRSHSASKRSRSALKTVGHTGSKKGHGSTKKGHEHRKHASHKHKKSSHVKKHSKE